MAGKNMAPSNIENAVPAVRLLGAHAVAIGHRRPYITALNVLAPTPPPRSPPSMASPTSPRRLGQSTANRRAEPTMPRNGQYERDRAPRRRSPHARGIGVRLAVITK